MSRFCSSLFACVLAFGCVSESTSIERSAVAVPDGCIKLEDADIGVNTTINIGGVLVTITWIPKPGEPNEFIGFTLSSSATFTVKAGQNVVTGTGTTFTVTGQNAISNVIFCDGEPPPCDKEKEECDKV